MREAIRSKVFLFWVLSYLFILLMPILIGTFVYVQSVNAIRVEVTNVNIMAMEQLKTLLDANFSELNRVVGSISLNPDVQALMSIKQPLEAKNMPTLLDTQDDLAKFLMTDTMLEEIYLYIDSNEYILTSSYKYNEDVIADVCENALNMEYEEFLQLAHTKHYENFRVMRSGRADGSDQVSILYIYPLFMYNYTNPSGMLIIKLSESELLKMLHNMELSNNSEIMLVNALDEYFGTDLDSVPLDLLNYHTVRSAERTFSWNTNGKSMTVAHVASSRINAEFVTMISTEVFLQKVSEIKSLIAYYLIICLVVGGAVAYIFAKWNYSPLERIKKMLMSRADARKETNEYQFLEDSLRTLLAEESMVKDILEKQSSAQRNNLLARLMKNRIIQPENLSALLNAHHIVFDGECFLVATVCVEEIARDVPMGGAENGDAYSLICKIVRNVGEELFGASYTVYMAEIDGMMAFIVNASGETGDAMCADCVKTLEHMISFVRESFGIKLVASVSDIQFNLQGVGDAYSETLLAFEYRTFSEDKVPVVRFDLLNQTISDTAPDSFGLTKQRHLANCVEARDFAGVRRILDDILNQCICATHSVQHMKIRVFGLVSITLNTIVEKRNVINDIILSDAFSLEHLLDAKSVSELQEQAGCIFDRVIECLDDSEKKQMPDYVVSTEDYVQAHYLEPDLSVTGIADHLGVSVYYLSRMYKKYRGIGLLDHIHITRLARAKELLREMSVRKVAQQVGYYDSKALIRAFKRYEGFTPGKIKKA